MSTETLKSISDTSFYFGRSLEGDPEGEKLRAKIAPRADSFYFECSLEGDPEGEAFRAAEYEHHKKLGNLVEDVTVVEYALKNRPVMTVPEDLVQATITGELEGFSIV